MHTDQTFSCLTQVVHGWVDWNEVAATGMRDDDVLERNVVEFEGADWRSGAEGDRDFAIVFQIEGEGVGMVGGHVSEDSGLHGLNFGVGEVEARWSLFLGSHGGGGMIERWLTVGPSEKTARRPFRLT